MFNKWCLLVLRFTLKTLNLSYPLWKIDYKYENLYYNSFPQSFAFLSWQYGSQDEPSHLSFAHQGGRMLLEESTQPSTLSSLKTVTSLDPLSPHSYTLLSAVTCILHLTPTSACPPSPLPSPRGTTAHSSQWKWKSLRGHSCSSCHQICACPLCSGSRKVLQMIKCQLVYTHVLIPSAPLRALTPQGACFLSCIFFLPPWLAFCLYPVVV